MLPQPMMPNPISDMMLLRRSEDGRLKVEDCDARFDFIVIPAKPGIQRILHISTTPRRTRKPDDSPFTSRVVSGFEKNRSFHPLFARNLWLPIVSNRLVEVFNQWQVDIVCFR